MGNQNIHVTHFTATFAFHLAFPGFSEQYAQCDTGRQLASRTGLAIHRENAVR